MTQLRSLSIEMIEGSPEIQSWLSQFSSNRDVAVELLCKLKFVSSDTFSEWTRSTLLALDVPNCALYAVRKFVNESGETTETSLWDDSGDVVSRPGSSLGSEDLIQSIISGVTRIDSNRFYDNPSITTLKEKKIKFIVLLDDSIGSGARIKAFLSLIFHGKTMKSWWSMGWIRIIIISFSRMIESSEFIIDSIPGSDHHVRKYPKYTKVKFISYLSFKKDNLESRWGRHSSQIEALCLGCENIPVGVRRGFGYAMTNLVFYHSVPDNLPGLLWFSSETWRPLFPDRAFPIYFNHLLNDDTTLEQTSAASGVSQNIIMLLLLIKRGIRTATSLSKFSGIDLDRCKTLLSHARRSGFITPKSRLTNTGDQLLRNTPASGFDFDRSLFVPE